jgi:hypothetical protein
MLKWYEWLFLIGIFLSIQSDILYTRGIAKDIAEIRATIAQLAKP